MNIEALYPGIWHLNFGQPESKTPVTTRCTSIAEQGLSNLPELGKSPVPAEALEFTKTTRGCHLTISIDQAENIYGFGLQLRTMLANGKKRTMRTNADPRVDTGDSHAPAPVFFSSRGYGVFVDTARYASFYVHTHATPYTEEWEERIRTKDGRAGQSVEALYASERAGHRVVVDIPAAEGIGVYIFGGPTLLDAVRRYNLFSGGGCLPPIWALGNWYRCFVETDQEKTLELAEGFEQQDMPFSVLGLEPGWQTSRYPNSFVWDSASFPNPKGMTLELLKHGLHLNLWENAFAGPDAPFVNELKSCCASETSTDGIAPDFLHPEGRRTFQEWHQKEFVDHQVSGFKLDECDNSDFSPMPWSFPEWADFPSGVDGEQMHNLYGIHYQDTVLDMYRKQGKETFGLVRSSGALAAPYPFALYSDLYDHREFIRGVVTASISGMLWTPEVRHAKSIEDFLRRVQSTVLSPCSLLNPWYIPMPPWEQIDYDRNHAGERMPEAEEIQAEVRRWLKLRQSLIPYLYTAFTEYSETGVPPFRALVLDDPEDPETALIDNQWMIGHDLLFAPLVAGEKNRRVYLPSGQWQDYFEGTRYDGQQWYDLPCDLNRVILFARANSLIPTAEGNPLTGDRLKIKIRRYGTGGHKTIAWPFENQICRFKFTANETSAFVQNLTDPNISCPLLSSEINFP